MEVAAGASDAVGVFAFGELAEVGFVAGSEFEGDTSPLVLALGDLHLIEVSLQKRVDVAGGGDFEELDERLLSDSPEAFFGAGVEAGEDDADRYGQDDERHDEECQQRWVADLAPQAR